MPITNYKRYIINCITALFSLTTLAQSSHSPITPSVPYEVRAVWLTTLMGLDWPKQPAHNIEQAKAQQKALCQMLDRLKECGINTVLFQARIRSTTAYPSAIEPWDGVFTGTPGKRPNYDPLKFAIDECHKRGMECHAWVVAFPICKVATAKQLGKAALPNTHPELCQKCGDQWMMDPGVPGTAPYLAKICKEIATNYDIDGIHLDYIRYPESAIPFNDDRTYRRYANGRNKATWRKENINRCVTAIHDAVKAVRPWIKMSCSPVGKYSDLARYSSRGWNARDAVSQDAQMWLQRGWMDMLFPMMYFDGDHYYPFLADWKENDHGRPVVPGLGIYFLNEREKKLALAQCATPNERGTPRRVGRTSLFQSTFFIEQRKGAIRLVKKHLLCTACIGSTHDMVR